MITTATDVNALPAIDMIAQQAGLIIENPSMIKTINMAFLEHRKIRIIDPYDQITGRIPSDLIETSPDNGTFSGPAIFCSDQLTIGEIPRETLLLRPLSLVIGIGCNRGTTLDEIAGFLFETLNQRALCSLSIKLLATTTLKQDETGILKLSELIGRPIEFFSKEALNSVKTIQPPSAMVLKHIGVKSVCEAAAILASGSNLIIPKVKTKNVTIAVARVLPDSLCSVPGREI